MQDFLVILIVGLVVGFTVIKTYRIFTRKPDASNKCAGCNGCTLKDQSNCELDSKKKENLN